MDIREIQNRRAQRAAQQNEARAAQEGADLEAIDALEAERGEPLHTMTAPRFKPGAPFRIAFRPPTSPEYKRYCDMVGKAQQKSDSKARQAAQEMLAECCLVYPAEKTDLRAKLLEEFPGTLISLAIEVAKAAELEAEAEGKG